MHKCFVTIAALITAAGLVLAGCSNPSGGGGDPFVPVTTITGLPSTATAGTPLTLTGTVEPLNATNRFIVWSVENPGTTAAAGTVVVLATVVNGGGSGNYTHNFPITVSGGETGTEGTLTINDLPSGGTRAVYVFNSGTDISTYDAITTAYMNGSYQALGTSLSSDGVFTLYTWTNGSQGGGFSGNGSFPVLLLNSGGSITDANNPMYAQTTVSFANGAGTVSYGSFTAVVYGSGSGDGGALTINNLPSGGTRAVYIFNSGTDISTYDAITTAYMNGSCQALGASPGLDGAFTLYTWTSGSQGGGFSGNGSFPVLLLNSGGSITDANNPMYTQTTVSFANGAGTVFYSSFTAVVYGSGNTAVTAFSLDGKVTAPVRGAIPDTTTINETQYTGTIAWQTSGGAAHTSAFAPSTIYKAVLTLTVKEGWTFNGVAADSFTYTGAAVANVVNSGTVTITFPATAAADSNTGIATGTPSVKLYLDGGVPALTHNGTTTIASGAGIFTVSIDAGSYYYIAWNVNGNSVSQSQGKALIALAKQTPGTYQIMVEAASYDGGIQSGAHTFTVE
jgi:hypothetical protein